MTFFAALSAAFRAFVNAYGYDWFIERFDHPQLRFVGCAIDRHPVALPCGHSSIELWGLGLHVILSKEGTRRTA